MNVLFSLFYFLLALLLLVIIHEYGHFLIARMLGVKVLRFSFGFGKILASIRGRSGTEYVFSLIPLGGYVKMLDETEGDVPEHEKHQAFNRQPLWSRTAIVLAGPIFNFIFSFCCLWLVGVIGTKSLAPIIGGVAPGSLAEQVGMQPLQEVIKVGEKDINSWRDFQYAFLLHVGNQQSIPFALKSKKTGSHETIFFPIDQWSPDLGSRDLLSSLGISPYIPDVPTIVGKVEPSSPAAEVGLMAGDQIISLNNKPVKSWLTIASYVKAHPNQMIELSFKRSDKNMTCKITIGQIGGDGKPTGYLGLYSEPVKWPDGWIRLYREGPVTAMGTAFNQTIELIKATFSLIGKLITGKLSTQYISGPVGIAQGAGESAQSGLTYYLSFLALISVSLGVLNLLPIPLLDGGHLLFYLFEGIRRRPLSEQTKSAAMLIGMFLLVSLMFIALSNDLSRLIN